jgi:DNA-binding NarL/FixJ family response regulator
VVPTCLLVDDSAHFLDAASKLLEGQGLPVAGVATTPAEALVRIRELDPDVALVDVDLNGESGFDLVWQLAGTSEGAATRTILMSTHSESDFADLVAVTPVLGFISKNDLSADAVRDLISDASHGHGCRHEALVYSSLDELAVAALPFIREGLARDEHVLVVLREDRSAALRDVLGSDAARVEFGDVVSWYRSPEHAFQQYMSYIDEHLGTAGAPRLRVVAEVLWPESSATADVAAWKRYEAEISGGMASLPVSFICAYDTRELPAEIVADARRTHPVLRAADGARPSAHYSEPHEFVRSLERDVPELATR